MSKTTTAVSLRRSRTCSTGPRGYRANARSISGSRSSTRRCASAQNSIPCPRVRQWRDDHAFVAKYGRGEGLDLRELWRGIVFADSQQTPGLRIADLVAQI